MAGMIPEQFLCKTERFPEPEILELMRLYGEYVAKEVRHKAAEIALTEGPEDAHRMIMNIQINDK